MFTGCISSFYSLFYSFEDIGLLDIESALDLYALHFVFTPLIQQHLDLFRQGWAHHHMRSEGNKTPQQLWIRGLQHANNTAITGLDVSLIWFVFYLTIYIYTYTYQYMYIISIL